MTGDPAAESIEDPAAGLFVLQFVLAMRFSMLYV
jgi:hypothetical protein